MLTPLLLAALFMFETPPPAPDVDLPAELDICILTAEVCALDATACDANGNRDICIKQFAICIEPFKQAELPSCRMEYAMCKLTESTEDTDEQMKHCALVYEQCPTLLPYP
jgi:hypothetical protein